MWNFIVKSAYVRLYDIKLGVVLVLQRTTDIGNELYPEVEPRLENISAGKALIYSISE